MMPVLAYPPMGVPAPGVAGPAFPNVTPKPRRVSMGTLLIAVVAVAVLAVLITVAFAQGSAFLRRGASPSPSARPATTPTLAVGAPGTISEVPLPTVGADELDSITAGPDGNLWFTEASTSGSVKQLGRITPQGVITEFPTLSMFGPRYLTAGPDGTLWFTEAGGGQIGHLTPAGAVSLLSLPDIQLPQGIATGPDGNLWISDQEQIVRLTPGGGFTAFPLPEPPSVLYVPEGITAGPDGNLWFTISAGSGYGSGSGPSAKIGRITPQGVITEFPLPTTWHQVNRIARGPDGNLWFTTLDSSSKIGRITPQGVFTQFSRTGGGDITTGPDGNLWFTTYASGFSIGRLTPEGTLTTFRLPNPESHPEAITSGPDGNVWFTAGGDVAAPMIGRIIVGKAAGSSVRLTVRTPTAALDERRAGEIARTQ